MSAVALALADFFTKKYAADIATSVLAAARIIYAIPILWLFVYIDGIPVIQPEIIKVYIISLPLECLAIILYLRAIQISPLSEVIPFLSFTPVFLLVTSPLILNEYTPLNGIPGILLIVFGGYAIHLHTARKGIAQPFKMIIREKGSAIMLFVAFLYSISSNYGKLGVIYSSVAFHGALFYTLVGIMRFGYISYKGSAGLLLNKRLVIIGLCMAVMLTTHLIAIKNIYVSYMIALKRTSLLFSIILGVLFLKEKKLLQKIVGGLCMLLGIALLTILTK